MNIKCKTLCLGFLASILWPINGFSEGKTDILEKQVSGNTITLEQVVSRVLIHNPELQVFSLEQRAREATILQSGLIPNPRLAVEVENLAGAGNFNGFDQSETTIRLSQLVELGGKRVARIEASSRSRDLSRWDYETKRIDVLTQTSKAFTDLLRAQRLVDLNKDLHDIAKQSLMAVSERVQAGKVSPIEKTKAHVELSTVKIGLERAKNEMDTARRNLTATWGGTEPQFQLAVGNLEEISPVPSMETLLLQIDKNPDLARWGSELSQRQAAVEYERSKSIPDVSLEAGYRRLEESSDNAIIFGISVPLQFFDRNQGAIAEARHRLSKAKVQKKAIEIQLKNRLVKSYRALMLAHSELVSLKTQVVPGAQSAYDAMTEGYRFGKFDFLEVLDSQRILFQARIQYLEALANYHHSIADVERLTGAPLGFEKVQLLRSRNEN
jgi:cobalt-zinc-cadmium efflux system outer membrane protein